MATAGFPNLFIITGPGSPSVLPNMPVSIEQHVEWIADCIQHLRRQNFHSIEATEEGAAGLGRPRQRGGPHNVVPQVHSWYMGANIPGKPRVFMPYAGGVGRLSGSFAADIAVKGYEGFATS